MHVLTYYPISLPHDIIIKIKINKQQTSQQKNPECSQQFCEAEKSQLYHVRLQRVCTVMKHSVSHRQK